MSDLWNTERSRYLQYSMNRVSVDSFKGVVVDTSRKAWIRRVFQLGVLLCIAGCTSPTPDLKPQLSVNDQAEALAHFSFALLSETSGTLDAALDHFLKAIQIDPGEEELYPPAIASALRLKRSEQALDLCRELQKKKPNTLYPILLHAQVCVLTDHPKEADILFRKAAQDFPQNPESQLAFARFLAAQNKSEEAITVLERIAAQDNGNSEILNLLGTLYIERARDLKDDAKIRTAVLKGITLLEQALDLAPDNPRQWQQLGYAYLAIQDFEKVKKAFEKAYALDPGDVLIARQLLDIYIQEGKIEAALAMCDELIRQTRTDPELWTQYLSEKLPKDKRSELASYLQNYITDHSDAPVLYHIQLGSIYLDLNRIEEAENVLSAAAAAYPDDKRLQTITGYLRVRQERYEEAYTIFSDVLQNTPDVDWTHAPFFTLSLITAAQKTGRTEEAANVLDLASKNDLAVLAGYMQMLFSDRPPVSTQEAIALLKQLQQLQPDTAEPFYYLTILQADQKNYDDALLNARQFETLASNGGPTNLLNGFFYYQYAIILERTGQLEEAETQFRKAIDQGTPTTVASAQNYIAYMWAERGEKLDMGLELVQQALNIDPDNAAFIDTLGWIYYMKGDYAKALAQLKKASEQIHDDPVIWEHIGDTYLKMGDPSAAIKHWKKAVDLSPEDTQLIERIEQKSVKPDDCPEPADIPADTPNHP